MKNEREFSSNPQIFILIGLISLSIVLFFQAVKISTSTAKEVYQNVKMDVEQETEKNYYDWAFNKVEEEYHTSNSVSISIDGIMEISNLEVLQVSDVEYVICDLVWVEIPGNGVFTVNLAESEFLIDDERHTVIVRLPLPRLTECDIDYSNVIIIRENESIRNGNYSQGEQLAKEIYEEGQEKITNEFLSNSQYLELAKRSAENLITQFIKNLNSEVEDLKVIVEFLD